MANSEPQERAAFNSPFKKVGTSECSLNRDVLTPGQLEILRNPSVLVTNAVFILTRKLQDPYLARSEKRLKYYSDQLTQLLAAYRKYDDGLRNIDFKNRNEGKGIAGESVFYTLILDRLGEQNIRISTGKEDKAGADFTVLIDGIEHEVDISASSSVKGIKEKSQDPSHALVFIPIETGDAISNPPPEVSGGIRELFFQEGLGLAQDWFTDPQQIKQHKAAGIEPDFLNELINMHTVSGGIFNYIRGGLNSKVSLEQSWKFMKDLQSVIK